MMLLRYDLETRDQVTIKRLTDPKIGERFLLEVKPDASHGDYVTLTREEMWSLLNLWGSFMANAPKPNGDTRPEKGA